MMSELPNDMEVVLPTPRNIAVIASLVALCCAAIAIPVAALGDTGDRVPGPEASVPQDLLDARERVNETNAAALEDAPPAVGASCAATIEAVGIGDVCRTPSGLLRVEMSDGSSATIHGSDAPPIGAQSYASGPQARVNAAGPGDIDCVGDDVRHYTLVYARPTNVGSRFADIAPKLRNEAYKISAFFDGESQSVDPKAGRKLPFACDGGTPRVLNATLAASGGVEFNNVVEQLKGLGYAFNSANSTERYLVYVDAPAANGAAGTGHVSNNDSSPDQYNQNNKGGLYAVQYNFADGGNVPRWDVMVHELAHTMGAVVNSAPHTSGNSHCNDGLDVMCYADGGSGAANCDNDCSGTCAVKVLDCNHDDYYNPAPAPGSYLSKNWNVAGSANLWLNQRLTGDQVPPVAPPGLVQTGASNNAIGLSWSPASDNVGVTGYDVAIRTPGGAWRTALSTGRRTATITSLPASTAYEVSVTARDAANNVGPATVIAASTNAKPDTTAPKPPTAVKAVTDLKAKTITFTWNESTDDIGVAGYEVRRLDLVGTKGTKRVPRGAVRTVETTYKLPTRALKAGKPYLYEVIARDPAGNVSVGVRKTVKVTTDKVKPTAPGAFKAAAGAGLVTLSWNESSDNVGVTKYVIYQKVGAKWKALGTLKPSQTRIQIKRLRSGSSYAFHVAAVDAAGNARPSRTVTVRAR